MKRDIEMDISKMCVEIVNKIIDLCDYDEKGNEQSVKFQTDFGNQSITVFINDIHSHIGAPECSRNELIKLLYTLLCKNTKLSWVPNKRDKIDMELGNIIFGNSRGEYRVERGKFEDIWWVLCKKLGTGSGGVDYKNEIFRLFPYYWGECTCGKAEKWEVCLETWQDAGVLF